MIQYPSKIHLKNRQNRQPKEPPIWILTEKGGCCTAPFVGKKYEQTKSWLATVHSCWSSFLCRSTNINVCFVSPSYSQSICSSLDPRPFHVQHLYRKLFSEGHMIPNYIWESSIVLISSFSSKVIKYSNIYLIFWSFLPWDVLAQLSAPLRQPALPVPVVRTALGWHLDRHLAWSPIGSARFLGPFVDWKLKNLDLGTIFQSIHPSITSVLHLDYSTSFEVMLEKASNWDLLLPIPRLAPAWIIGNTHIKFLYLFENCISFSKMKKAPFWLKFEVEKQRNSPDTWRFWLWRYCWSLRGLTVSPFCTSETVHLLALKVVIGWLVGNITIDINMC